MLLWIFPRWAAVMLLAIPFGTPAAVAPRTTSDKPALLRGTSCAMSASVCGPNLAGGGVACRAALIPPTIEALGQITKVTAFEFVTRTGESRVRMVFPMRGCTGETQRHGESSPALSAAALDPTARLANFPGLLSCASGMASLSSLLGNPSGDPLMDPDNPWFVLAFPRCEIGRAHV